MPQHLPVIHLLPEFRLAFPNEPKVDSQHIKTKRDPGGQGLHKALEIILELLLDLLR